LSDSWYYADYTGQKGPVTLQELKATLARLAEPENVLVWHEGFTDWMKAGAVAELKAQTSRPADQMLLAGEVLASLWTSSLA
jgi:predicted nucleic acid-binding protein